MKRQKTDTVQLSKIRIREALRGRLAKDAEKAAKSLNAEIVDRLEASYTKDERIEELKKRLDEVRPNLDAVQAAFEKDRDRLHAEIEDRGRELENLRRSLQQARAESEAKYAEMEADIKEVEGAAAVFDALVGEDGASREAARAIALLVATNPGWAANPESIQKMVQAAGAAIHAAASKEVQQ